MLKITTAFFIAIVLIGCSTIKREAGYPGGNFGYLADRHALFAKGHEQQVNRYFVTLALLTPLVAETVETPSEAKLSAERIKYLYKNIEKLQEASKKCTLPKLTVTPTVSEIELGNCDINKAASLDGSALSFESLSFEVSKSLNDALKQSFDNLEIRSNASKVIALEPTELLKTILKARHLIPVLLRYLSAYRDVSIIFGQSVAESCDNPLGNDKLERACDQVAVSFGELINRSRNTDEDVARQERPISAVFNAGEQALNAGLDWQLTPLHRVALLNHVNRACKKLDALAKIDEDTYIGCTIDLDSFNKSNTTETTQETVESLISDES